MCNEQHSDIPVRTLVSQLDSGWKAHCLDFDLVGLGSEIDEAVERLEEQIALHLEATRTGVGSLFRPVSPEVWADYYQAAEQALRATGPGHAHIEHRPLVLGLVHA